MIPANELILLDTNVLVAYIRGNDLGRYIESAYALLSRTERPLICVVTVGEILCLSKKFGWGATKQQAIKDLLNELVIVDINIEEVLDRYSEIGSYLHLLKPSVTVQQNDMWIAAVASVTEANLITTDRDYSPLSPDWLKLHWIDESLAHS